MQEDLVVSGNRITGTLKKLTEGTLVHDWGEGYFMALDFSNLTPGATIKVGLDPSEGSGLVELDEDHNGVFKVTNKNTQNFKVVSTLSGDTKTDVYRLNGLTLEE